ncbi:MAG: hypothetical protein RLZZ174_294 [Pseudomonadota bacterium]|jgi:N-carbamoyl-L-amino-acid hydrolase
MPLKLDFPALFAQLETLGQLGAEGPRAGRTRLALTDAEKAGRDQLVAWMRALDLTVEVDQLGNVFGSLPAATAAGDGEPLMIGSHIDTVRNAGALDGCYGVFAGLAVLRAFREAHVAPARRLVVAAFTNEEGVRYQPDMMGSLVYAGGLSIEEALATVGTDGTRLGDELHRIGYAGSLPCGAKPPWAFLELHIEQGPVLEAAGKRLGVVSGVQGISWQRITLEGEANHAGTAPMAFRRDAGYGAAATIAFLREQITTAASGTTLATVGSLRMEPDVINVVPARATFTVDLRDPDDGRLRAAEAALAAFLGDLAAREGLKVTQEQLVRFEPVVFPAGLRARIHRAAEAAGEAPLTLTSGAGHDAQMLARVAPAAMIFVPSVRGISHNPAEHTSEADLALGAEVLLRVVEDCLAVPLGADP